MYYESYFRIDILERNLQVFSGLFPQILFTRRSLLEIPRSEMPIRVQSLQLSSLLVGWGAGGLGQYLLDGVRCPRYIHFGLPSVIFLTRSRKSENSGRDYLHPRCPQTLCLVESPFYQGTFSFSCSSAHK
jgi:hypothetical protein